MGFNLSNFKQSMKNKKFSNKDLVDKLQEKGIDATIDTIKSYRRSGGKNRQPTNDKLVAMSKILDVSVDYLLGNDDTIPIKTIPLVGIASCGVPNLSYNDMVEQIVVPAELARDGVYAVRADGDSMEPKISHGDIIICDTEQECMEGNIAHYTTIDGESGVKKYSIDKDDVVTLFPLNREYPPVIIHKSDLKCARAIKVMADL